MEIHKWQPLLFLCSFLLLIVASFAHLSIHTQFLGSKIGDNVAGLKQIKQYLINYGYMSPSHINSPKFDHFLEVSVKKYQTFFHLNASGVLDSSTLSMMAAPRCGVPDHFDNESPNNIRGSFYRFGPRKWSNLNLTWSLDYGTRYDALNAIYTALRSWETKANVFHFTDENGKGVVTDLKFGFYRGQHGDNFPFDGQGGKIAHATFPTVGVVHFDADEIWAREKVDKYSFDVTTVALHEIGHALGLAHSKLKDAIMYPSIHPGLVKGLHNDDIAGLKAMYSE